MPNKDYTLWCLIERDDEPFFLTVPSYETIDHLKQLIVQKRCKNDVLQDVDPRQLILKKASHITTAKDGS